MLYNIAGQIKSPTGSGVQATIRITSIDSSSVLPFVRAPIETDVDGNYTFTLGSGSYSLELKYEEGGDKIYLPAVLNMGSPLVEGETYSLEDLLQTEGVATYTPTLYEDS